MISPWRLWADRLTLVRALMGLPLLLALATDYDALAWWLLLIGGWSDAADGWLARRADGGSTWGARLDPLADKLLISAPLIWLASEGILPVWAVWLLLARELLISGWRGDSRDGAPASTAGKAKTILQFLSLALMLWPPFWGDPAMVQGLKLVGVGLFWPSLLLALWSAWGYLKPHRSEPGQR
ncbi:CDP-alcohol phosphatidyltransferase family protein [Synechococcus sp. UW179B]|uniref:CDP-alcohol phosphatidyltransferase family protein n=1 Tax=Synechococcus sp. UW179B TaxID=2575516 RepID=UPI000E0F3696|nr:CDP-alcohol phosphatidyltransferase family protein [Synechococcus sp. UW179B]